MCVQQVYGPVSLPAQVRGHAPMLSILAPGLEASAAHSGGPPLCAAQVWARECNVVGLGGCPRFCSHMRMCMHKQKRQWACSSLKYDVRNGIYASFYVYDGSGAFLYDVHPTECDVNVRWYYTP